MTATAIDLDYDAILRDAQARAGVGRFSNEFYLPVLRRLLEGFEKESNLNEAGRAIQRERIVGLLATNLRFESYWAQYPEIAQEEIVDPIVIVGFGRTGSTLLQRLLAADPRAHAPLWWEGRFPVPFVGESVENPEQRIATAKAEVEMMYRTVPGLESIHPLDAMQADEEILLLEQSFYSDSPESFAKLLEFGPWRESLDQTPGYAYMKRMLQFLQWQKRKRGIVAERWILKSPQHIHSCDVVLNVFPGARIVQTHRDPLETIPSWASLCYSLWQQNSDTADPKVCGAYWDAKMARGIERCMRVRDAGNADKFFDVDYRDTARDPLDVAARICAFVGWDHTIEAREAQTRWLAANRRDLRPPHEYTMETFGYTEAGLKARYREYRERFVR
ncbi:MAG: sulfotransferase [Myxococcota bacterium]